MHHTLERLINGDSSVVSHYEIAKKKWEDFFEKHKNDSIEDWAKWLTESQILFFERNCGGRWEGQEVMAWSGFATLYSIQEGFGDNQPLAEKLAKAFEKSACSLEVKTAASQATESYWV
ncbi:MAG: hypothetical protein PUP91_31595 [Rhizonema sp. PD37]|nr:hypothetical protein [Rhizonema sp. PD37]